MSGYVFSDKIMQTRHAVEGLHNFQEISQPSECLNERM